MNAAERVYRTRIFSEFTILKVLVKKVSILSNRDFRYRNEPLARRFNQKQTQCDLKWGQNVAKVPTEVLLKILLFSKMYPKLKNLWATFVRKCVAQESPIWLH